MHLDSSFEAAGLALLCGQYGRTALMIAARQGHHMCVSALVSHCANADIADKVQGFVCWFMGVFLA
jgi:hypothetical protein